MNAPIDPSTVVFFDGRLVPLSEARIGILTHAFQYGTGVIDGIRAYWDEERRELFVLRPGEHFRRWKENCGVLGIATDRTAAELSAVTVDLLRRNLFRRDVYIRVTGYKSAERLGVAPDGEDAVAIAALPLGRYHDSARGIHAGVVSWRRIEDSAIPGRAKISGAYANSALAAAEARRNGYDEAILLTHAGHVAEASTSNVFLVRHGRLITPPASENVLEGITRDCVMELARRELRLDVVERPVDRSELYLADEVFLTGTAVGVSPVVRVDHHAVGGGEPGPVASEVRHLYMQAAHGRLADYRNWVVPVYETVPGDAAEEGEPVAAGSDDYLWGV